MQTGQQLERRDAVLQFNPFLDGNGVLRAKGRLRHAPIPWNQKHPIILDIKDLVTCERSLSERTYNRHF